ncbi:dihydrofolate reductase family protein [Frankia sp. AgB32]|uniref:dihydrofolate reductase family protein n=1 Tax=Frankia sp. AgB32 TaxID=631119 RepID=UPI00200F626C|nr:dihydrofolate reductase family protein [Frankia sp. AgB32]MCK9897682.1 dihydrofolate reductase family protein [Frankia sp. AgB32]
MARLAYTTIASLDGYVVDASGDFSWSAPDEEVHTFINELERPTGTYLLGRRMYEVMSVWETMPTGPPTSDGQPDPDAVTHDFARLWQAADKVVYSSTLASVTAPRTRLEREFDPAAVRSLVASAQRNVSIGGPTLASHAIRAGLVDEYHLFLTPIVVGGGVRSLPDDARVTLELRDERRFSSGVVYLRYQATG